MNNKYKVGDFDYYRLKTRRVIVMTILYFAISLSLFVAGYIQTGSNKNVLTIVAVLGLLPASKSAVSMVMYLRYHGCPQEIYDSIHDKVDGFLTAYGLVMTTYKKNYEIPVTIIRNGYVYLFLQNHTDSTKDLESHVDGMIRQNGLKGKVGVYTKQKDFEDRLEQLRDKDSEDEKNDAELLKLMGQLSL